MGLRYYCTYFDHRYLAQGLALYNSMHKHVRDFHLFILALDAPCATALQNIKLRSAEVINLDALEKADPELKKSRHDRSLVEFYFTCTPCFLNHLLSVRKEIDRLTYIDADTYFFSDPHEVEKEAENSSIAITPHRFRPELISSHLKFGTYNVGWLSFKKDEDGLACLALWRKQCLQWCKDEVAEGRFGDQGYLDEWPKLFPSTLVVDRPGFNEALWNVQTDQMEGKKRRVFINRSPLILFHFQGLRRISHRIFNPQFENYGIKPKSCLVKMIYRPYLATLVQLEREAGHQPALQDFIRNKDACPQPKSACRILSLLALCKKILQRAYLVAWP